MARSKAPAKKQQKHGVDFKKIKRKIGGKLPPPKNAMNTEIKSKAIVLPKQSVASDKAELAVNKKGFTLKELLQQTSHYSSKVRKDALLGMKNLLLTYPEELRLHKYAVVEKLRERIGDDDRLVREKLYQLFKSVILAGWKEDNQELLISLMMAYIFNAMTHLAINVRLMAFKFLELATQYHPLSFFLNAEKCIVEDDRKTTVSISSSACRYYLIPCFVLFDKSHELLNLVLNTLGSWITQSSLPHLTGDHTRYATDISSMVDAVVYLLQLLHKDDKICQIMSSFMAEIDYIMEGINLLQSSEEISMTVEERHKVQHALDRLQNVITTLHSEMQSV